MSALSDTFENKLLDWMLRAQAIGITGATAAAGTGPANTYVALFTVAPIDSTAGTEVTGGSYARVAVVSSLANWAGTQGAGTTTASSGTGGTTSNNNTVTFPTPTVAWGTVVAAALFDAITGGNMLIFGTLSASQVIGIGNVVTFPAAALQFQIDN